MRALIPTKQYTFCINDKNKIFDREYNLSDKQKCEILQSLTYDDCVKIEPNNNARYPDTVVYVFLKECEINVYGELENIKIYIKLYILEESDCDMTIIISFHREGMY